MKAFEDCLEGRFSNKYQAMKNLLGMHTSTSYTLD